MRIGRWAGTAVAVVAIVGAAGCSTTGGPAGAGDNPRQVLVGGAEPLAAGGSARAQLTFTSGQKSVGTSTGVVSWKGAGGSTGDLNTTGLVGDQPVRALYTQDALYTETTAMGIGASSIPGLAGKKWLKVTYAQVREQFGALGTIITAGIEHTNPVRSAALLAQSPDLRDVGQEQVNGIATTHYTGTLRYTDAVEDLRLGLDRAVLDEVRSEIAGTGASDLQQYDLWIDDQGHPIRARGRSGAESYSVDYSDYGPPRPVQAPPAGEVVDQDQLLQGLGPN